MKNNYGTIKTYCDQKGVTLVAISKTKPAVDILALYESGQHDFGENKVQELQRKHEELPQNIHWHLVGHLQTNKVKYIAPFVSLIHSVDSWKLLEEIQKEGKKINRVIDVLLQIHIAQEETKFGLSFTEARVILNTKDLSSLSHVSIRGIMGMATLTDDAIQVRKEFKGLKKFFDEFEIRNSKFEILSMGMSSDYKIAIEEGSNLVRIGSAIFGERM